MKDRSPNTALLDKIEATRGKGPWASSTSGVEEAMSETRSPEIGQFDALLTEYLASGRNESRAGLAISLCEAQGDRSYRNWREAEQIVDDYCRRHALHLPLLPKLTWSRARQLTLSAIGIVAGVYALGYVLHIIPPMARMFLEGLCIGLSLAWLSFSHRRKTMDRREPESNDRDQPYGSIADNLSASGNGRS
jgi:hypothetical protein